MHTPTSDLSDAELARACHGEELALWSHGLGLSGSHDPHKLHPFAQFT